MQHQIAIARRTLIRKTQTQLRTPRANANHADAHQENILKDTVSKIVNEKVVGPPNFLLYRLRSK